jgi:gliding motility-associated-like protein
MALFLGNKYKLKQHVTLTPHMNKLIRFFVFLTFFSVAWSTASAQFPYFESFRKSKLNGIVVGGAPSAYLTAGRNPTTGADPIDPEDNGYLRLTNASRDQKGFAYSTSEFPSKRGLKVEFEYYIYGGNGADGISFFLFDANAVPFTIGGFGGSLGYAQYANTTPTSGSVGVSGGYLGVGLDEYGNFSNPIEGRQGGPGFRPGSITLRGQGNGNAQTSTNYPFLTTVKTVDKGIPLAGNDSRRFPETTSDAYRKVFIDLEPSTAGGYLVTVRLTQGGPDSLKTVVMINKYHYTTAAPVNLKYGFASSTGDNTNFHEVRNVAISVFDTNGLTAPKATADVATSCPNTATSFNVTANDESTNSGGAIQKNAVDLDPAVAGLQKTFAVTGKGTFSANDDGTVTFSPSESFTGPVSVSYTVFDNFGFLSNPTTFTVNYNLPAVVANAGSDIFINFTASSVSTPLSGNDPTNGFTGAWTYVSGPSTPTFTNNTLYNTTVNNLIGGAYVLRWTVSNAAGCSTSDDVTLNVNRRPTPVADSTTTNINIPVNIKILDNDTDPEGAATIDISSVVIVNPALNGTVSVDPTTGIALYTPKNGYTGPDEFTYTVKDNRGLVSSFTKVSIEVISRPVGINDDVTTPVNTAITISIKDNDPSNVGTTVVSLSPAANGIAVLGNDGKVLYTPNTNFSGKDIFTYRLRDVNGIESTPITVTVNVKPVGSPDNVTTPLNTTAIINIKGNDVSGSGTTPVIVSNPLHGSVNINSSGNAVFVPTTGYTGNDVFTYKLRTADGLESDPITVTIAINPGIPAPDVVQPASTGTPVTIPIPVVQPGGSYSIVTPPLHGTITTDPATGRPIYTPTPGYIGTDEFTYTLRDPNGVVTRPGKVTINVTRPPKIGLSKSLTSVVRSTDGSYRLTYLFTIVNFSDVSLEKVSLTDDLSVALAGKVFTTTRLTASGSLRSNTAFDGVAVKELLLPTSTLAVNSRAQVELELSIAANQNGGSFSNTALAQGTGIGTGALTTDISTNGLVPDPNTPGDVTPQVPTVVLLMPNIILPVNTGTPKIVDVPVPIGGSVTITKQPAHGTITFDPTTGRPIYTPSPGYTGPDDFTYIVRDANGNESQPAIVVITVTTPAKIGLAKVVKTFVRNLDGTYNVTYTFTLKNFGNFALERVGLSDNLSLAFPGITINILDVSSTGTLRINNAYNGATNTALLLNTSTLAANATETVTLGLRLTLGTEEGRFNNFAIAEGYAENSGTLTQDQSTDGLIPDPDSAKPGDVTPSELTPVTLVKAPMKIPEGFSPNGDGINDFFVVENALGKTINLEVYNRWGNRIYRSKDYKNTWDGRTTEGIYIGSDVPVGTYYYTITIDGKDRKVGVLTINR